MKKNAVLWLLFAFLGLGAFWACDDDNDNEYLNVYQSIVTVTVDNSANTFYLTTEKGNKLVPDNQSSWLSDVSNGQKAIATFTIVSGSAPTYTINLVDLQTVLTKSAILYTTAADTAGNVQLERPWYPGVIRDVWYTAGQDTGYVNIVFSSIFFSDVTYVNLIADQIPPVVNPSAGILTLRFVVKNTGAQILPPSTARGIVAFAIPLSKLSGVSTLQLQYQNFNNNPQTINLNISSSSSSSMYSTEFSTVNDNSKNIEQIE